LHFAVTFEWSRLLPLNTIRNHELEGTQEYNGRVREREREKKSEVVPVHVMKAYRGSRVLNFALDGG